MLDTPKPNSDNLCVMFELFVTLSINSKAYISSALYYELLYQMNITDQFKQKQFQYDLERRLKKFAK